MPVKWYLSTAGMMPDAPLLGRRIQKPEEEGAILRRVTLLSPDKLNVAVTLFVSIKMQQHSELATIAETVRAVSDIPEVVEFYNMSGDVDLLLRVVVPDIQAYTAVYKKLLSSADLLDLSSSFALERFKYTTALPLHFT